MIDSYDAFLCNGGNLNFFPNFLFLQVVRDNAAGDVSSGLKGDVSCLKGDVSSCPKGLDNGTSAMAQVCTCHYFIIFLSS